MADTQTLDTTTLNHGEIVDSPLGKLRFVRCRYGEATFVHLDTNVRQDFPATKDGLMSFPATAKPVSPVHAAFPSAESPVVDDTAAVIDTAHEDAKR